MDTTSYIESGILELYVAGVLSEDENREVYEMMRKHPEVLEEVLSIEAAIIKLTAAVSPNNMKDVYPLILQQIRNNNSSLQQQQSKVVTIEKTKYDWLTYTGWAAAILLGAAMLWLLNTNNALEEKIVNQDIERSYLETQIEESRANLEASEALVETLRDNNVIRIPLAGQANFAETYANVYWDKEQNQILLDAAGLPEPPEGKVYQVWSLTMNPLTPTSLGVLEDFGEDENKIFTIENALPSEAFGITLEPDGGSETPTMEQLYTLGAVPSETAP